MNLVKAQVQNFIVFEVDALTIWSSKCLLQLSIMRAKNASSVREFNCGDQPTISMSVSQLLETPTVVISPRSQLPVLQDDQVPEEQKTTLFWKQIATSERWSAANFDQSSTEGHGRHRLCLLHWRTTGA